MQPLLRAAPRAACAPRLRRCAPYPHRCRAQASSSSTTTTTTTRQLLDLVQWSIKKGIKFSKVRPESRGGARGMFATFDIASGEVLLSVPTAAALRTQPGEQPPAPEVPKDQWAQLPWFVRLALKLDRLRARGGASEFGPYLASLPDEVDLPLLWPEEDLQQLHYAHLHAQVQQQRRELEAAHEQLRRAAGWVPGREQFMRDVCCVKSRSFAAPCSQTSISDKLRAFALAQAAVAMAVLLHLGTAITVGAEAAAVLAVAGLTAWEASRSAGSEQHAMCPLIDMFNHSAAVQTECQFSIFDNEFRIVAAEAAAAGQEVAINYGARSNDALLLQYGFWEPANAQDRYVLPDLLSALHAAGRLPGKELGELQALAAAKGATDALGEVPILRQGFPAESQQALASLLAACGVDSGPAAVAGALAEVCRREMATMPSSLEEDVLLLQEDRVAVAAAAEAAAAEAAAAAAAAAEAERQLQSAVLVAAGGSGALSQELGGWVEASIQNITGGLAAEVGAAGAAEGEGEAEEAAPPLGRVLGERERLIVGFRAEKKQLLRTCLDLLELQAA